MVLLLGILVSPVQADPVVFRSLEPKGWETRWLDTRCSGTIKEQELRSHFGIVAARRSSVLMNGKLAALYYNYDRPGGGWRE